MKSLFPPLHLGEGLGKAFFLSLLIHLSFLSYPAIQSSDTRNAHVQRLKIFLSPAPEFSASHETKPPTDSSYSTSFQPVWTATRNPQDKSAQIAISGTAEPPALPLEEPARYFSNRLLDQPTVPASGPDPDTYLKGKTDLPIFPVRLRLYVDSLGTVRKVELRAPEHLPSEKLDPIRDMLMATRFIPGQIKQTRLPSYLDIEIDVSDYAREVSVVPRPS